MNARWRTRARVFTIGLAGVPLGCNSPEVTTSEIREADLRALGVLAEAYVQAVLAEDDSAVAALYDPAAVQVPPGEPPVVGRSTIRTRIEESPEGLGGRVSYWGFSWGPDGADDGFAYDHGSYAFRIVDPEARQEATFTGKYLVIFRRQAEGSWLIWREAWIRDR